jgi:hypothetical protein
MQVWTSLPLRGCGQDDKRHRLSYTFKSYARYSEQRHGYAVLRSDVAALDMTSELKRIARTRSDKVETGGLIFGEIDDAHQVIWVDSVSGPPPDSTSSDTAVPVRNRWHEETERVQVGGKWEVEPLHRYLAYAPHQSRPAEPR